MDRSIRAGISGALLAIVIELFLPVDLGFFDFLPSFFAAVLIIFIFRLEALRDGFVATFMTYVFEQGIVGTLGLATYYIENKPYTLTVDILLVFSPIVTSISALIAGYAGVRLVKKMKPIHELQQQPPLPPPLPPV